MDIQKIPASRLNAAAYNPRKDLKPGDREQFTGEKAEKIET